MTRIALIHATPLALPPIAEAFQRLWPDPDVFNLLDDSLSTDLARLGRLDDAMTDRFRRLARYAAGCDSILFTCYAFGPCIEVVAEDLKPMPVLKPNEAMFAEALKFGGSIGLIATFAPSLPAMTAEFDDMAAHMGVDANLISVCTEGALDALSDGDSVRHDNLIAEAAESLSNCDAIMLAQFSMANVSKAVESRVFCPVLTSPDSAVRRLRD